MLGSPASRVFITSLRLSLSPKATQTGCALAPLYTVCIHFTFSFVDNSAVPIVERLAVMASWHMSSADFRKQKTRQLPFSLSTIHKKTSHATGNSKTSTSTNPKECRHFPPSTMAAPLSYIHLDQNDRRFFDHGLSNDLERFAFIRFFFLNT